MIPILMYHQIAEVSRELDPRGLAVPPNLFKEQMSYLARAGYRCLSLSDAARRVCSRAPAPAKSFVLTFDDGYQDFHSAACPILEQFGFTATVFLVANQMGGLSNWADQDGQRSRSLLSPERAQDLARRGILLGSHSLSHPRLSRLDDPSAFREIQDSKLLLEDKLGLRVDFFSYPYSDFNTRTQSLVEAAGYTAACGGFLGAWGLFNLWRAPCGRDDTMQAFAWKANGWYHRSIAFRQSTAGRFLRRGFRSLRRFARAFGVYRAPAYALVQTEAVKDEHD